MEIEIFGYSAKQSAVPCILIISSSDDTEQRFQGFSVNNAITPSDLTLIIEALESFEAFDPNVKAEAIALCASELGINQLHFYKIAHHASLGGAR